jgi:hypothetical protein
LKKKPDNPTKLKKPNIGTFLQKVVSFSKPNMPFQRHLDKNLLGLILSSSLVPWIADFSTALWEVDPGWVLETQKGHSSRSYSHIEKVYAMRDLTFVIDMCS